MNTEPSPARTNNITCRSKRGCRKFAAASFFVRAHTLGIYERSASMLKPCGAGESKTQCVFLSPRTRSLFREGAPSLGVKRPQPFLARVRLRQAFGEKPLLDYWRPSRDKPDLALLLVATSPAGLRPRPPPEAAAVRFVRLLRARHEVPSPCSSDRGEQTL